jgi:hypothetical protein
MPLSGVQTIDEKKRNRHETRTIAVFDARLAVVETEWQPYVAAVVQVERTVHAFQPAIGLWNTVAETSFYLSNRPIDAACSATIWMEALRRTGWPIWRSRRGDDCRAATVTQAIFS